MTTATWFDMTFRTDETAEVTEQPDGRFEMSWPAPDGSRLTVIVTHAEAEHLAGTLLTALTAPAVAVG